MLVGWVMDWKSANFHNGRVIFGGLGAKNTLFLAFLTPFPT
jgi:hypothetical protein